MVNRFDLASHVKTAGKIRMTPHDETIEGALGRLLNFRRET